MEKARPLGWIETLKLMIEAKGNTGGNGHYCPMSPSVFRPMRPGAAPASTSAFPSPGMLRPRAFRQSRLLIVGCGDVGQRVLRELGGRLRVRVLTYSPERVPALRRLGARRGVVSLAAPASVAGRGGLVSRVLPLAPAAPEKRAR